MSGQTSNNASGSGHLGTISAIGNLVGSVKQSFDNAGGNQILTSITSSLPDGTKAYIEEAKSRFFKRENIRPISVFFGIGEEKPFYMERHVPLILERLKHNTSFFYMNYILLTAVLFMLTLFINPSAIIGIALLGFAWLSVIRSTAEGSCQVRGIIITQKQATVAMSVVSSLVLFYLLSNVFWWTLASSGFFVGLHALFRDASMHKDEEDKVEMTGDIGINDAEDAAFLNPAQVDVV